MQEKGLTFKQAVNEAIRAGAAPRRRSAGLRFDSYDMGEALVDVTKALQLAGELEDQDRARGLSQGK